MKEVNSTNFVNFRFETSKNMIKLSLSKFDVNQKLINDLSEYLQTDECLISELILDGINLENINVLCCLTPNTKISKLWLRCCQLKDKGVYNLLPALDETHEKSQLNLLYLDCNGITCEGAKKIAQVLRTNRTLQSLSLARNVIKNEGALALVNILSKFNLNDNETKWIFMEEQRRIRLIECLMDIVTLKIDEKQENIPFNDSKSTKSVNNAALTSINEDDLKQKAEGMLLSNSHAYSTSLLLKSGSNLYCPGNFKIRFLNISYNRFGENVIKIVEKILRYQQKICLAGEGIKTLKIEGFETKKIEIIHKIVGEKRRIENKSVKKY